MDVEMLLSEVKWIGVLLATISTLLVGATWYHKRVFGSIWMHHTKVDPNKATGQNMAMIFASSLVIGFIKSLFIAVLVEWVAVGEIFDGFMIVGGVWGALIITSYGNHYLFEQRSVKLFLINAIHDLIVLMVITSIIFLYDYEHFAKHL